MVVLARARQQGPVFAARTDVSRAKGRRSRATRLWAIDQTEVHSFPPEWSLMTACVDTDQAARLSQAPGALCSFTSASAALSGKEGRRGEGGRSGSP